MVPYSAWLPNAPMYSWPLQFWQKWGESPLASLTFSCSCHCHGGLCGSCFYPNGSLLPCIKLWGAECSLRKQNQQLPQEVRTKPVPRKVTALIAPARSVPIPITPSHLLVMLHFTDLQTGWGLWAQTAPSERICSAPLFRAGVLRAGCSRCVQQGWRQKKQKINVRERQGSGIAQNVSSSENGRWGCSHEKFSFKQICGIYDDKIIK